MNILIAAVLMVSQAGVTSLPTQAPNENECKADRPCYISKPAGDGCDNCVKPVYFDGKNWREGPIIMCTAVGCYQYAIIENPFTTKQVIAP